MMNKKITFAILLTLILLSCCNLFAQGKFEVKFVNNYREDAGIAYNFFVGNDTEDFATSINGFGSGFILDLFTGRYSIDLITFGTESFNLSLGAGVAISKYRFSENIILEKENDIVSYRIDNDPNHDYVNTFFGYGKSKLVVGTVYMPVNLNISLGKLYSSAGGFIDQYLSAKHKRKFIEDDKKKIELIKNNDFNDFNLNKTKFGINALVMHKKSGIGLGFTYMITPFFQENKGPELNEARISFTYDFSKFSKKKRRFFD